ncbi:hypothetical protein [Caulobacter sp. UNC279MFTsu5.1]|uniref:hypothetical protein n=1 Tax=Caulobacter sp. UNC279MFTsu5.1 TaxID=1502775 RepID=UPI0008E75827|nr:hypothetical protein [Caulobacter sp. UNC279MFTsu5.1]SFI52405.1 hypothetical protein SAMN02799626_00032 [Caulobacter sp. UNC279MFTsu5.1]
MGCLICTTSPTVKSHILPRALFHAMKREGQQLVAGRKDGPGYRVLQSGEWDDRLLCAEHEAALGGFDRYGVEFCREAKRQMDSGKRALEIPNPKPRALVGFACACIWRYAASRSGGRPERALGPYAQRLKEVLFEASDFSPLLLVSRHAYEIDAGETMNLAMLPHIYNEEELRFWRFIVCGLIFDLKLDNRPPPPAMATLAVNDLAEIHLFEDFPQKIMRQPALARSLQRMYRPPARTRRGR